MKHKPKKTPPAHLGRDGRALWRAIVDEYGIADGAGLALVSTAAEALDRMRQAQRAIKKHGVVLEAPTGHTRPNPACKIEVDSRNGMLAALKALNLDIEPLHDQHPGPEFDPTRLQQWEVGKHGNH